MKHCTFRGANTVFPYETTLSFFKIDAHEKYLLKYVIKPSDAIQLSAMKNKGIVNIVSEDEVFEKVEGINRVCL